MYYLNILYLLKDIIIKNLFNDFLLAHIYFDLIRKASNYGIKTILDTGGKTLAFGIKAKLNPIVLSGLPKRGVKTQNAKVSKRGLSPNCTVILAAVNMKNLPKDLPEK